MSVDPRTSSTLEDIYIYVLYTHVNSEAHVAVADLLSILQGDNDQLSAQYRAKATSTSYTRLYTILVIYLHILHTHVTHHRV